jgi:hypothetical protein
MLEGVYIVPHVLAHSVDYGRDEIIDTTGRIIIGDNEVL